MRRGVRSVVMAASLLALGSSACSSVAQLLPPEPAEQAQWAVDPEAGVDPEATEVPILVREVACNSGQDATGRISTDIEYGPDEVVLTVYVQPRGGDQTCPSNPLTPYVVELEEPLGDRELVNGATDEIAQRPLEFPDEAEPGDRPVVANGPVPDHVLLIAEALHVRANDHEELGDVHDLSPHPDGVGLYLGDQLVRAATPEALGHPEAWILDVEHYAGATGPFSILDSLDHMGQLQVTLGAQPHCASPARPSPEALDGFSRVAIEPAETDTCLQWQVVNLYLDDQSRVRAIQLDLWEP